MFAAEPKTQLGSDRIGNFVPIRANLMIVANKQYTPLDFQISWYLLVFIQPLHHHIPRHFRIVGRYSARNNQTLRNCIDSPAPIMHHPFIVSLPASNQ